MRRYLTSMGIEFDEEVHISYRCIDATSKKFSRIDVVIDIPARNLRILLEIDETQHDADAWGCDVVRMNDTTACVRMSGDTFNLLWLRFNPDAYKVDGVTARTRTVDRHAALKRVIDTYVPTRYMAVMYMYFDTERGVPCLLSHPEYPESFKDCVI